MIPAELRNSSNVAWARLRSVRINRRSACASCGFDEAHRRRWQTAIADLGNPSAVEGGGFQAKLGALKKPESPASGKLEIRLGFAGGGMLTTFSRMVISPAGGMLTTFSRMVISPAEADS